jgi:hypothetical protein
LVDSGVSLDPALERVLVPSCELERVRCPLLDRLSFKKPTTRLRDCTPRRLGLRRRTTSRSGVRETVGRVRDEREATLRQAQTAPWAARRTVHRYVGSDI